jgi:protein nanos 1
VIARKTKQQYNNHSYSHYNSCDNLPSSRSHRKKRPICTFCKSNGESASVYTSHGRENSFYRNDKNISFLVLRNINNEIECPILMSYVCPKCGATGKSAHTIKYCTALSESERVALPTVKLFKEGRTSSGKKNLFKK